MLIWIFNDLSLSIENMRIWTYFKLDWTLDALFARSKPIEIGNSPGHVCIKNLFRNNIFYSLWFVYLVAGRRGSCMASVVVIALHMFNVMYVVHGFN